MPAHIHAEKIIQYGHDAMETDKPWERWELKGCDGKWKDLTIELSFCHDIEYRRKQKTFTCNGFEILDDRFEPGLGDDYYAANIAANILYVHGVYTSGGFGNLWISRNIVHRTKEGAIAHAKAMLGIDPNE